jgi:hypothetical protein
MFYGFRQVWDKPSQKIYLTQERLYLLFTARGVDLQNPFNPAGVYFNALFGNDVPQKLAFFYRKVRFLQIQ